MVSSIFVLSVNVFFKFPTIRKAFTIIFMDITLNTVEQIKMLLNTVAMNEHSEYGNKRPTGRGERINAFSRYVCKFRTKARTCIT